MTLVICHCIFPSHNILGTSIGLVPSGRLAIAGFADGTFRLFDLTGIFAKDKNHPDNRHHLKGDTASDKLFDDDASTSSSEDSFHSTGSTSGMAKNAKSTVVNSHSNQRYGAVACQIHARGVHTSLLMDVAVSEDGLYAFGGVQRGSVELAAIYLGDVESYLDERLDENKKEGNKNKKIETPGLLDLIQVDRHADAKLKGFGACTRLWNGWERARNGVERPEYLLFTGKGIKVRDSMRCYSSYHVYVFELPSLTKMPVLLHSIHQFICRTFTFGPTVHHVSPKTRNQSGRAFTIHRRMELVSNNCTFVTMSMAHCKALAKVMTKS